jgi:hypothetical protein
MLTLAGLLLIACLVGLAVGRAVPRLRVVGLIASTVLVAVGSWIVWTMLLILQIVRIDPVLRWLGVYRLEPPWNTLLFFGPPALAAAAFALVASRRRSKGRP